MNGTGNLATTLQLYHALRLYSKIPPMPMMDSLLALCAPTIFAHGSLPKLGELTLSNYFNIAGLDMKKLKRGKSVEAGFNKDGHGRGALPVGWGSSFVADLVAVDPCRLSAKMVKELVEDRPHVPRS